MAILRAKGIERSVFITRAMSRPPATAREPSYNVNEYGYFSSARSNSMRVHSQVDRSLLAYQLLLKQA